MAFPPRARPYVRRFNHRMEAVAERVPPFVVIDHVGRKTGTPYRNPLVAFAGHGDDGATLVATPMVWGREAGWCRNVQAAGRYGLTRRRRHYLVDDLRIVDSDEAARIVGVGARVANATFRPKEWIVGRLHPADGRPVV